MESTIESIFTRIRVLQHLENRTEDDSDELLDHLDRKTQLQDKQISDLHATMATDQRQLNKFTAILNSMEKKNNNTTEQTQQEKKTDKAGG